MSGGTLEARATTVLDATGVWGSMPDRPFGAGLVQRAPVAGQPPRRPARPHPGEGRHDAADPGPGRVPRAVAAPLAHRHDRQAVSRAARPAGRERRGRRRDPRDRERGPRHRPVARRRRRHVRRAAAARRAQRLEHDGQGLARAPRQRRARGPRPDQRRQVHDLPGDGPRRGRRRARAGETRRRPSSTAELPLVGAAPPADLDAMAARLSTMRDIGMPSAAIALVDRHGTEAEALVADGAAPRPGLAPRQGAAVPRGRGRLGRASRSSRCRSTTSSSGGCGSPRSSAIVARRSPRGSPRSSAPTSAGTSGGRRPRSPPTSSPPIASSTCRHDVAVGLRRPRPRPGHDVVARHRLRPCGHAGRHGPARVRAALPVAGPRHARPGGDLGEPARGRSGGRRGRRRGRERRRHRHHEPARDDGRLGSRDGPAGRRPRSSGRAGSPPRSATGCARTATSRSSASAPGCRSTRTSRAPRSRTSSTRVGLRSRAERGELALRHRRQLARRRADRRAGARDRRLERLAHAPVRHPRRSPGTTTCCGSWRCPRAMLPAVLPSSAVWAETDPFFFGRADPDRGRRGRPAGGDVRAGLLRAGRGEEHLRHGRVPARQRRRVTGRLGPRPAVDGALAAGRRRRRRLRARGLGVRRPAPPSSGCATGCAPSRRPPRSRRSLRGVEDTGGVYLVPAFSGSARRTGIREARGLLIGLTRGTGLAEIARATHRVDRLPGRATSSRRWPPTAAAR